MITMFCFLTIAAILKSISKSLETAVSNVTLKLETAFKAIETNQKQELDRLRGSMKAIQKQELDQIRGAMEAAQREEFVQLQGTLNQHMDSIQSQLQVSSLENETVFKAMESKQKQELDQLQESLKANQKQKLDQIRGAMEATQREGFVKLQGTLSQRMDSIQSQLQVSSRRSSDASTAGSRTSVRLPIRVPGPISPPPILSPPLWGQSQNIRQFRCGSWPPPPVHPPPLQSYVPEPLSLSKSVFSPEVEADEVSVVMSHYLTLHQKWHLKLGTVQQCVLHIMVVLRLQIRVEDFPLVKKVPGKALVKQPVVLKLI